jgi:peptidoglycan/LPS O-acetylase OafA/YrhL
MFKFWYLFQLGVMGYWAVSKQLRDSDFIIYASLIAAILCWNPNFLGITGWLTGVGFYLVGRYRLLGTLDYAPLQFLGRRSYSLYLIHFVIGMPFVTYVAPKLFGPDLSLGEAMASMAVALVVSIAGASVFYRFIERPSINLGRSLKQVTPKVNTIEQSEEVVV